MINNPKLSIITPSFNQAKYLPKTLDSVLALQDYCNIEHFVIDGGSKDGTVPILKEYKDRFPEKLFFVSENDSGQSNAINKGFKMCTGDIIGWINSDDYYEDNIFSFVMDFFDKHPEVDMVYGKCNIVNASGEFVMDFEDDYGFKKCGIQNLNYFSYQILLNVYSGLIPQPTVFFRNKIIKSIGYLNETFNFTMDYEYWLRIGKKFKIAKINQVMANYRTHPEAKTNYKNYLSFIKDSIRARKLHGGKFFSRFSLLVTWVAIKIKIKMFLVKIGVINI